MRYRYRLGFTDVDYARLMFSGDFYRWVERAMESWQQEAGLPWRRMILDLGLGLPSTETRCHYLAPIEYEDEFEVGVGLRDLTERGFVTDFEIVRVRDGRLAAYGYIVRRFLDMATLQGENDPPEEAVAVFRSMEGGSGDVPRYEERTQLLELDRRSRRGVKRREKGES